MPNLETARLGIWKEDHDRFGLIEAAIEQWENCMRTNGGPGMPSMYISRLQAAPDEFYVR
jgi:hypothetical protein